MLERLIEFFSFTGSAHYYRGNLLNILVGSLLFYVAIKSGKQPLLLTPIGFGTILANRPSYRQPQAFFSGAAQIGILIDKKRQYV